MNDLAVIFDMDGVICDTNPYHALAFREFFKQYNIQATEEEFNQHMYGKHNSYIMQHFLKRKLTQSEIAQMELEKEALFRELYQKNIEAIDGFIDFLTLLKQNNIKTAIATSAPGANLNLIATELNLYKKMDSILYSERITQHKPHPEIYLKSAELLNIAPEYCLVFEDSHSGASAGLAAGMSVCAVLSTHTKEELPICNAYIKDFKNLNLKTVRDWIQTETR